MNLQRWRSNQSRLLKGFSLLVVGLGLLVPSATSPAFAAEKVVLKYQIFRRSVAVADLTQFAETGETSRPLRTYLRMSGQDPEKIRETLTKPVAVNLVTLDRVLNSFVGDLALGQLSQYIYTSSRQDDDKAIRAALVLSANGDNEISILEVLQNYPTQEVILDGDKIIDAYEELQGLSSTLDRLLEGIRLFN
ncbi:MAG: alpha/beta hydrolase [Drouetiella hepatica Uher 2000/2452]|uniref:Alpha/beta hydrolase n=1 Tax=Drouetiella hepatica Uher 2000/2452 TaxID=904376 RepID=A0A951ULU6_9CYAN|nr:alpha/beta hydrolase [Drouetiella hepatica Uher 2000/2452]